MLIGWISNLFTIALGLALLLNKRHSHLKLAQLYVFGTLALSLLYKNLFFNWHFYPISVALQAVLFALAYWEIAKKDEGKPFHFLLLAAGVVFFIPIMPIPALTRSILPFLIIDAAIAITLPFVFKTRNPFLLVWGVLASYSAAVNVIKILAPQAQALHIMRSFGAWTNILADLGLICVIVWQPVARWAYHKLKGIPALNEPELSFVPSSAVARTSTSLAEVHNIVEFTPPPATTDEMPALEAVQDEMDILNPVLKTAAMMLTLNHKPFLSQEEIMFYLDLTEKELNDFMSRHEIQKVYLTSREEKWVVRREAVENVD